MKITHLLISLLLLTLPVYGQNNGNPFEKYGYKARTASLTDGRFPEYHDQQTVVEIGSVLFDTKLKKVVGFTQPDTAYPILPVEVISMSPDPMAAKYYSITPYAIFLNNPIRYTDPTGMVVTRYEDANQNLLLNTNDGSNAIVTVSAEQQQDFMRNVDAAEWDDLNSVGWNRAMVKDLTGVGLTNAHESVLGQTHSDDSKRALMSYWQTGSVSDYAKFGLAELGGQWTTPSLVASGVASGFLGWALTAETAMAKGGVQYTKSSLKMGQQMHKNYHAGEVGKEFRLPSGKRIDFLDINNRTIYELKPYNPRGIQTGTKQLNTYMQELQTIPEFRGYQWKTVLDFY